MGPVQSWDDFLDMTRRRMWVISFVAIIGAIVSLWMALNMQHIYRSSEVIQIEQPKIANELAPTTVGGSSARRQQLIQQQLMARDNLQRVIDQYGLFDDLPALKPSDKVNMLRQSVRIEGVAAVREGFADDGTISVLTITAELGTAELARDVAREFAEQTRALTRANRDEKTRETLEFFTARETQIREEITALEDEMAAFRAANDLSIDGSLEFRRAEIASLNEAILAIDRDRIAARLALNQIDRTGRASTVERQVAEAQGLLDSLDEQRIMLQERRTALASTIDATPEIERQQANFERRMTLLQGQLDVVSTRRSEAEIGFSLESNARGERLITLEEATLPDYPITPSRKKRALMGAVAALVLGFGAAYLLEWRNPVIRSARQMEREIGIAPVVSIPMLELPKEPRGLRARWRLAKTAREGES